MKIPSALLTVLLPALAAAPLRSQFGNTWVEFVRDDTRLVAAPDVGAGDVEEKDYAVADFDRDGWDDLVCVRKQPVHTTGRRRNVLFMNENGVLVDRTREYASASDVAQDLGFLTPTNDRDIAVTDVDMDGWPDLVTATTLSPNTPKHVSHPRVYRNLGADANGAWLGFRFEDMRIPQLLLNNGAPSWPRFTAVAAGDLTNDGYPDLYFGDNDDGAQYGGGDMNDRLLVNDGTGKFFDASSTSFPQMQTHAFYTTGVCILDLNQDGFPDVARNRGFFQPVSIAYNDPSNPGVFTMYDEPYQGLSYCIGFGDINRDDRPDLIVSENGDDTYHHFRGLDGRGAAVFGKSLTFDFLTGSDDGFAADSYVADFDGDGSNDVLICDYDPQIPGCARRTHIYHNLGGEVGDNVVLREEAEQEVGGWRGAVGLLPSDLRGTHDAGILDLDRDGDLDLVFGRCSGTFIWMNQTNPVSTYCTAKVNSQGCAPVIATAGSPSATDPASFDVSARRFVNEKPGLLFYGLSGPTALPFEGGTLCVQHPLRRTPLQGSGGNPPPDDCSGAFAFDFNALIQSGVDPLLTVGAAVRAQYWARDPAHPDGTGSALSDAVVFTIDA